MQKRLKILIPVLIITVAASAYFLYFKKPINLNQVKVSGNIEVTTVGVGFKIAGHVDRRLVDEGESVIAMIEPGDYKKHLLLMFENGKAARIELSAYETKTNRRKLVGACSDKSPVKAVMLIGEEFDVACYSSDGRAMIFNTALLQPKTSRSTQGVAVMSLKAKRVLEKALPLKDSDIQNTARYRVRSIPASGALIKGEDRAEKEIGWGHDWRCALDFCFRSEKPYLSRL